MNDNKFKPMAPFDVHRQKLEGNGYLVIERPVVPEVVYNAIRQDQHMYVTGFLLSINENNKEVIDVWNWVNQSPHHWNTLANAYLNYPNIDIKEEEKYYIYYDDPNTDKVIALVKTEHENNIRLQRMSLKTYLNKDKQYTQISEKEAVMDYKEFFEAFATPINK